MNEPILMAGTNEKLSQELCAALEREHFRTISSSSLVNLELNVQKGSRQLVILDLDTLPVDNRYIRNLRRHNPGVCIIGLSSRSFHPELEEAMSSHIFACLGKPVDFEELIYWIRCIQEDEMTRSDLPEL